MSDPDLYGEPLIGEIVRIVPRRRIARDEITGDPLPVQPKAAEPVVFVELAYALADKPATLSIEPPMRDDGFVAANVGFVAYHASLPVTIFAT